MNEKQGLYCEGCGHSFPSKEEDIVPCPHCGTEKHIPGALACKCGKLNSKNDSFCQDCGAALFRTCDVCEERRNREASFCSVCGSELFDEEVEFEDDWAFRRKLMIALCIVGLLLAAAGLVLTLVWMFSN